MHRAEHAYVTRIALRQRVVLVVVRSQDGQEALQVAHARLRVTRGSRPHRIALEDVVSTAVVVVDVRSLRLRGVARLLVDLADVGNVVRRPVALRVTRHTHRHVLVQIGSHVLLDGQTWDLLDDPHDVLRLPRAIQIHGHPLRVSDPPRADLVVVGPAVVHLEGVHPRLGVVGEHVAHLASLPVTSLLGSYDEGGHGVGGAVLVQRLVVDGVRRLHGADAEAVHVEIVLRVDEA